MGRLLRGFAMVFAVGLLLSGVAQAKDDKGKGKDKKDQPDGIELTGIEAFDSVFSQVADIDKTLSKMEGQLRDGKNNLNEALDLKKGTPVSDGLAELKTRAGNKVQVAMDKGGMPKLEATDALPSNVQGAVEAVNAMTSNFGVSIQQLTDLAPEMQQLVKQTSKMPGRLVDEFSKSGGGGLFDKLFKLPKISKALTQDVQLTAGLPDRANGIQSKMTDIAGSVSSSFGGPNVGGGGHGGGGSGKPAGGGNADNGGGGGKAGGGNGGGGNGGGGGGGGGKGGGAKGGGSGKGK
jgi:hypothetical protein